MASLPPGADLSTIPLALNPKVQSNFTDPESLAPTIVGLSVVLITITLIWLSARVYANLHSTRRLGWDDCFALLGFVFTLAYNGLFISMDRTARRGWNVPLSFFNSSYIKRIYAIDVVYEPGIFFAKAAMFMLYLRVFAITRHTRLLVYLPLLVLFLVYASMIPVATVYCTPRAGEHWDLLLLEKCHETATVAVVQGVFGLVSDIYIFAFPIPMIIKLHLPFKKKLGLLLVFMAGIFAIVASALGLYFRVLEFQSKDPTWTGASTEICVIVENYITIIVGCTPAMAGFWRKYIVTSRLFESLQSFFGSIKTHKPSNMSGMQLKMQQGANGYSLDSQLHPQPHDYVELLEARRPADAVRTSNIPR